MVRITQIKIIDRLLLIGPPGIGKTEIVKQLAEEEALGKKFIDLREASNTELDKIIENPSKYYVYYRIIAPHVFPEDLGIPRVMNNGNGKDYVEFLPPKVLKILSLEDVHGVLFIDEITNVQRDDQLSMLYSLILEKEASWILKLSRNIKIVLAGNPQEWSEITRPLPKPLRNRAVIVNVDPPTVDEWIEYMEKKYGEGWDRIVAAYLKFYPSDFLKPPAESDDFSAFPSPRSWTRLATLLAEHGRDGDFVKEIVYGTLGSEVGARFLALIRTNMDINKTIEELNKNPDAFSGLKINERILVIASIAQRPLTEIANLAKILQYFAEKDREMLIILMLMMDKKKRLEFISKFRNIVAAAVASMSKLFGEVA